MPRIDEINNKQAGNPILSEDWNAAMNEIIRLNADKLDKNGGFVSGDLKIDKGDGTGVYVYSDGKLEIKGANDALSLFGKDHCYVGFYPEINGKRKAYIGIPFNNHPFTIATDNREIKDNRIVIETVYLEVKGTDISLSGRTNKESYKSHCRALVDGDEQLIINYGRDFIKGTYIDGYTNISGNLDVLGEIIVWKKATVNGLSFPASDYAELFESENGEQIEVGVAVVFSRDGKIRPAKQTETPIGVISALPGILGNSFIHWPGRFEKDEYGRTKMEQNVEYVPKSEEAAREIEALTKDGKELSVKDRNKLMDKVERSIPVINPEYDPSKNYIPREERPEWQKVGLLGQLPITKGQPTAPSWVKIKDISDHVELWLVK